MRAQTLRRAFLAGSILSLIACSDDNAHLYRAGEPGGPTGPGYWNDYYCQWAGGVSVQRATMPSYPKATQGTNVSVASPTLQDTGADQLLASAKKAALAQLEYQAAALKYQVEQRTSCDLRCEKRDDDDDFAYNSPTGAAEDHSGGAGSSSSASQASGTNNQVAGVDEADFLKNDNKYMYVAANGALRVIDAFPGNQAHELSKPEISGAPKKLLTTDTVGVVFSSAGTTAGGMLQECTYGYSCVPTGDGLPTNITVLDISDKSNPKALRTIKASGSLLTARRIGNMVHAVIVDAPLQQRLLSLAQMQLTPAPCVESDAEYAQEMARIDAAKAQAVSTIESVVDVNPSLTDSAYPDTPLQSRVYTSPRSGQASVITVLSFSVGGESPVSLAAIVGNPGHVYASATSLYMAVPEFQSGCAYQSSAALGNCGWYDGYESSTSLSSIHTFELGTQESPTRYVGSALVQGTVLNQFSMDEYDGHLRVATTDGHTPSPGVASTLTVLRRDAAGLVEVGKVGQIAPTEDIRSVRFDGDRGFVVTFKKTDPLFAFDLADPKNPRLAGELKIPGFSTYMHLMDRTHLLTIGYDADDHGSFAFFNGIQLQIFDVSDLNNPTLLHKESIGTRGSSSEALTNHLAFTYFAPKQLLALPMTICEGGGDGSYGTNMTFNGLIVYRVTLEEGFQKLGGIPLGQNAQGEYNHALCSSWWTDANSSVKRSVIMDDFVYSVSEGKIQASVLSDLEHPVAEVPLK